MKSISEIKDFEFKRVIVRADWNVPVDGDKVLDTSRIEASFKTLKYILNNNGSVILVTHFGRSGDSLEGVFNTASAILKEKGIAKGEVIFLKDPFSHAGRNVIAGLMPGDLCVLENIRLWPEEEQNDEEFARKVAKLGEIYVNDAFSASHREHASIVGIPKILKGYAGFSFLDEVQNLSKAFSPEHPFLFILGGAKIETKLPLIEKFLAIADQVFVGGLLASEAQNLPLAQDPKVMFPHGDIHALDVDQETIENIKLKIQNSKFVLWNGPVGAYEKGYTDGTKNIARALAESNAHVILGGGDTLAAIKELGISNKFAFVSTSGGAMLDFLAYGTLPGIEALK